MKPELHAKTIDQQLAYRLVRPLKNLPFLHPNHFTLLTLVLGQSAAGLFAFAITDYAWLAALCYMLAVFSDHLDGEYARLTGKTSKFGHDFDFIVGGLNYTALFIGIGTGLVEFYGGWTLVLGLAAGLCNPFILLMRISMERDYGTAAVEHPRFSLFDLEDFIYLIGPITWLAGVFWFFLPYGLGTIGYLVWTGMEFRHWKKECLGERPR